ncbi:arginine and glutamate-rich protein 1-like [Lineus longissimus]|uniref:arginine and glutamate-rich protein 1-like n=1 Tax=Lineus longissimus TaxID=88925 RepID=UPI00315D6581
MKAYGVEHEFTENEQLLSDILDMNLDEDMKQTKKKTDDETRGKEIRKKALETLTERKDGGDGETKPAPKRQKTTSGQVLEFMAEKASHEHELKEEELKLKKQQLKLEEERFKLDREERQKRMEREDQEGQL